MYLPCPGTGCLTAWDRSQSQKTRKALAADSILIRGFEEGDLPANWGLVVVGFFFFSLSEFCDFENQLKTPMKMPKSALWESFWRCWQSCSYKVILMQKILRNINFVGMHRKTFGRKSFCSSATSNFLITTIMIMLVNTDWIVIKYKAHVWELHLLICRPHSSKRPVLSLFTFYSSENWSLKRLTDLLQITNSSFFKSATYMGRYYPILRICSKWYKIIIHL